MDGSDNDAKYGNAKEKQTKIIVIGRTENDTEGEDIAGMNTLITSLREQSKWQMKLQSGTRHLWLNKVIRRKLLSRKWSSA